ncbi:hypothetical protein HJC23_000802 [Cyclotella cryptica]|uniref:Uncharacterized protein n=1 Tax=Cyclotella cryptica TaxID=29204 RepID=A0ABD3Q4R0_9STRA|eukprot:CCRYP_008431-RA/>CCRYP_008431-RA protein AED:0.04 eAED:0.04 QI:0/-1/0/1/-1/1/1/0/1438
MTARPLTHRKKKTRRKNRHKSLLDKIHRDAIENGAQTASSHAAKVIESRDDDDDEDAESSLLAHSSSHDSSSIGLSRFASDSVSCVKSKKVSFDDRFYYISFDDAFEASYGDDEPHHASRFDEVSCGRTGVPWWWALGHESVEDSSLMDDEGNSIQREDVARSPRGQGPWFDDNYDMSIPRTEEPDGHRIESHLSCESWISEIGQEVELDLDDQTECSGDHSLLTRGSLNYQPKKPSPSEDKGVCGHSNANAGELNTPNQPESDTQLPKKSGLDNTAMTEGQKTSRTKSTSTRSLVEQGVQSDDREPTLSESTRKTVAGTRAVLTNGIINVKEQKGHLNRSFRKKSRLSTISEDGVAESSTITRSTLSDTKSLPSKQVEESIVVGGSAFTSTTKADIKPPSTILAEISKTKLFLQTNLTKLNKLSAKTNEENGCDRKQFPFINLESVEAVTQTSMSKSLAAKAMRKLPLVGLRKPKSSVPTARNGSGSVQPDVHQQTLMNKPSGHNHTLKSELGKSPDTTFSLDTIEEAFSILPQVPECTLKPNSRDRMQPPIIEDNDDVDGGKSPPHVKCSLRSRTVVDTDAQDTGEVEIYFQPTMAFSVISDALPSEFLEELPTNVAAEQSKTGLDRSLGERTAECLSGKNSNTPVDESCSVIGLAQEIQTITPEMPNVNMICSGRTSPVNVSDNPLSAVVKPPNEPDFILSVLSTSPDCQLVQTCSYPSITQSTDSTLEAGAAPLSSVMDHLALESPTHNEFPSEVETFPTSLITENAPHVNPTPRKRSLLASPRALWVNQTSNQMVSNHQHITPITTKGVQHFSKLPTSQDNSCSTLPSVDPFAFESLTPKEFPDQANTSPELLINKKPPHENSTPLKFTSRTSPRACWVKGKSNQEVLNRKQLIPITMIRGEPISTLPTCQDNASLHTSTSPACIWIRKNNTQPRNESTGYLAVSNTTVDQLTTFATSQIDEEKGTPSPYAVPEHLSASSTSTASTKSQHSIPKPVQDSVRMVPHQAISRCGSHLVDTDLDACQNGSMHANTSPHDNRNESFSKLLQSSASREYILEEVPAQAAAGIPESPAQAVTESPALVPIPQSQSSSSKSQLSQLSGLNEDDLTHSFESMLTLDWDLFDDISDIKSNGFSFLCKQPICQKIDTQCDDHIRDQGAGLEHADSHLTKNNHSGLFCKHPKLEPLESRNDDDEFVEGGVASLRDERNKFDIAEAAYEAICHCVGHEQFSDILGDPIKVDDSPGLGVSIEKTRSRKIEKKKRKPKKLLTPINEEDPFQVREVPMDGSLSDTQTSKHQHCSLPASTELKCQSMKNVPVDLCNDPVRVEQSWPAPSKNKIKSMFTFFGRKKKLKGKDIDVLTLIQSNGFMESIMKEIQLEARGKTRTSDFSCIERNDNGIDDLDFPSGFSDMLIKQIAEEAVKKCLEDLSEGKHGT